MDLGWVVAHLSPSVLCPLSDVAWPTRRMNFSYRRGSRPESRQTGNALLLVSVLSVDTSCCAGRVFISSSCAPVEKSHLGSPSQRNHSFPESIGFVTIEEKRTIDNRSVERRFLGKFAPSTKEQIGPTQRRRSSTSHRANLDFVKNIMQLARITRETENL